MNDTRLFSLDNANCDACGRRGCVSWSATEGARCMEHSSYVGPRAEAIQRGADAARASRRAAFAGTDAEFAGAELDAALESLRLLREQHDPR